ncbi:dUTP diphosphatase [Mycoplasmopsis bovirhinis]|uniref:dUTP diphosphatase n=1 Tax=Mycoplasmopsis bovirhinis TaxID=29553 RepID=UPI00228709A3|nr:dUTP diphosphatase [Mycoplasmopsis bovirhinis]
MHFFISLSYQNDVPHTLNPKINEYNDINLQFKELFINISEILKQPNKENIQISFEIALGCFEMLGYNYNELFEAYFFKNQKNYKRLYSNY